MSNDFELEIFWFFCQFRLFEPKNASRYRACLKCAVDVCAVDAWCVGWTACISCAREADIPCVGWAADGIGCAATCKRAVTQGNLVSNDPELKIFWFFCQFRLFKLKTHRGVPLQ